MNSRLKFLVVTSSTCITLLLLLGTMLGNSTSPDGAYRHLRVYTEVLQRIKSEYVEEPDMKSVTVGALNGMLEAIDPFASYLNADQYKDYLKHKDEKRANLGLVLAKKYGYLGVVGVIPNSPAEKAGLASGDMIEAINSVATRDMPLAYASLLMGGEPGTTVELSVVRVRRPEPHRITLTRAPIAYPPVRSRMMANQVGYIRPETLAKGKVQEVANAVRELQKQGARKLILDLRNSAVGTPEDGVALADLFMSKGLITYLQGQRVARQDFNAEAGNTISSLPLVVITNRGTADAAEVAAAALLDSKRAEVVGEKTYGDASVRRTITMDDGGAIILSVAKYYSPSGKAIHDTSVTPNHVVNEPEAAPELDENGEPLETESAPKKSDEDPLLNKALEVAGALKAAAAA
jgi:carboxyl-terminal processing protease